MTGWGDRHEQVKEVWFAGDHSDVGGGHPSGNSPLADASLRWMLGEATQAGLRLNAEYRDEIGEMDRRSLEAPSTPPHDLWWKDGYWLLDHLPRVELFNARYPPKRRPRVLWADGARTPADHIEGAALRFHWSVEQRSAHDSRLSPERLARGTSFQIERDLPILEIQSPPVETRHRLGTPHLTRGDTA
jgi:hypothetical protein